MGSGDSSAQLGGHNQICSPRSGAVEAAAVEAARGPRRTVADAGAKLATGRLLLAMVRAYIIFLSPYFGGACKYYPSCSNYAHEAIARHGARRGLALAMRRLGRCRPFTKGGFDPVPDAAEEHAAVSSKGSTGGSGSAGETNPHYVVQGQQELKS